MLNKKTIFIFRLWLFLAMIFPMVLWSQTEVQKETKKEIQSDTLIEVKKVVQPKIKPAIQTELHTDEPAEDYPKQMGIGFKSGAAYSTLLVGINVENMKGFIEPTYGLIFSYIDTKIVGIQIELNYLTKSWEESPVVDTTFNGKLTYLEIPLLTTFHFGNKFKFIVNGGPYLSILLNEESSHTVNTTSDYLDYYDNRIPRGGDFGLMGGAGFRLQTKIGLFQAEARYTFGFQNIYDPVESNLEFSNLTTLSVFLSYQILFSNGR